MFKNATSSAVPLLAAMLAAMAFAMGAIAFESGRQAAVPEANAQPVDEVTYTGLPTHTQFAAPQSRAYTELVPAEAEAYRPAIALVIDDMGSNTPLSLRALDLPATVTLSILPYSELAPELDTAARARGHETLIHVPMQPEGNEDPGPNALSAGQDVEEVRALLEWARQQVPGADGFNNHMGSALTSDPVAMDIVFAAASGLDLYFLDSMTHPASIAHQYAENYGLTALSRDIFIDHINAPQVINAQLAAIETLARERGAAIAIGHPRTLTLDALEAWIPSAQARGFRFVALHDLARPNPPVRTAALNEAPGFLGGAH